MTKRLMNRLKSFSFNTERTFGVELEFFGVHKDKVIAALNAAGINTVWRGYTHTATNYWKLVTDCSVTNRGTGAGKGLELVSPVLKGKEGLAELRKAVEVLDSIGAKVDKSCGLHVHHDVDDFNLDSFKNIYRMYYKFENFFDAVVPISRRKNNNWRFCKGFTKDLIDGIEKAQSIRAIHVDVFNQNRYYKLNIDSYFRHGTLEFRQHNGTHNADKVINWVIFTQAVIERAKGEKIRLAKGDHNRDAITDFQHERRIRRTLFGEITRETLKTEYGEAVKFQIKRREHFCKKEGRAAA